ncbi:MAG: UDP-N-acetylmuramoylalanine-D-glutamate ligase [Candidatus Gottesmanbacteria bacterium GW2011_GWB1_43_11]|uniref:UDP-N-acetylmuramoylalanine--D-glutamate ligase n=1 Tax=Candidatus Gottesmanbacteria bacterium GW2011_GWB1_43_11 TaxID=1618446 RepID=A0A0G1FJ92_9BACT|nr:MAG: UDP-N-acetylmuramoylalanine-D-glutamate ligase [Candidatus Gottesmanbacteria bacterium GW2011_GWA2_42_16]KKS55693.1 MAG: UDP-N-acetylmuramoylalanine-D-glutamate ligase [Candidatus Gottesmanbacteria bacterium GW2011_GWA1_42_26]KKS81148.1 MAG: UDP-N-acetylmuramoylalanine-D-glutamate ligase [Candidatus Gottesmanbacteria bacterium GW2011_GWC1_43_10]KKS86923.1 MAG: UDP-N-acetylmuramoylalanine-D-glutamate ligase [Candidatus Gottesmanbacteria bacterium GW2011_GWB1_43_11]OGG08268.1 MAG: UDP-N-a
MNAEIKGQAVLILGYGREGQAVHRFLNKNYPELAISIADWHPVTPLFDAAALHLGPDYLKHLSHYPTVIRSPGIPAHLPELVNYRRYHGHLTSGMNLFFALCPGQTIGITGTKGKSTTSSLLAHILSLHFSDVRLVGNIGRPALDDLTGASKNTWFVVELSSHQLEDINYSPQIAVILAIYPEHLDYYPDFKSYIAAKTNLIRHQDKNDLVIFNPNHAISARLAQKSQAKKFKFALKNTPEIACFVLEEKIWVKTQTKAQVVVSTNIPLLGQGNLENVLAATSVAHHLKVPLTKIKAGITSFTPLPHRLEFVAEKRGIRFYNDSLATIPEATIHALKALGEDVTTLIAGGFDRNLNFTQLAKFLSQSRVQTLILFPETGSKIWQALDRHSPHHKLRKYEVASMAEAVQFAFSHTPKGKICLMSPAAASFNLFKDYAERGDAFKRLVLEN